MRDYVSLDVSCLEIKAQSSTLLTFIAAQLSSIIQPDAEFNPETIYVRGVKNTVADVAITYSELSEYFKSATGRYVPALLETRNSSVDSNRVMVNREWLERQLSAAENAATPRPGESTALYRDGNFQGAKRDNYEQLSDIDRDNDVAHTVEGRIALQNIQTRLAEAESLIIELRAKEKASADDNRSLYNELRAKDKKIQEREAQIELLSAQLDGFVNCFNPKNPVHPKGLYEAFQCWQAVTDNGTRDPSGPGGRGAQSLVLDWLRSRGEHDIGSIKNPGLRVKRLATVIGWRGKGSGAIRSK